MPFTVEQLAYAGKASIDFYLKNDSIDQINVERPLIKKLMAGKSEYSGGLQYVVEQLRFSNDSNFQGYFGDSQVTYNRKRTLQQAKFAYGNWHDGFGLNEDELRQNGIRVSEDMGTTATADEKVNLTNLLKENNETLKLGFQENFDLMLHRDGTQSALDVAGLDSLISLTPTTGTVGTLDAATYTWWRNYAATAITSTTVDLLVNNMEVAWRECMRYGGSQPDFILVGAAFLDAYRRYSSVSVNRQSMNGGNLKGGVSIDAGTTGIYFKGVELVWDPVFDILDTLDAPAIPWTKRGYFINTKHLKLKPIKGSWMVSRKPPRIYDRYVQYWALTASAALTTNKRNAHAVLSIA